MRFEKEVESGNGISMERDTILRRAGVADSNSLSLPVTFNMVALTDSPPF